MGRFLQSARVLLAGFFYILASGCLFAQSASTRLQPQKIVHVGVLAFRGADAAVSRWQSLMDYLSETIDGSEFKLVPVTLVSAHQQIEGKKIDFLITNPGHYVDLAAQFSLSALATRERLSKPDGHSLLEYGSAIIVRSDSLIKAIDGLKGKTLAAVSPDAFGGFQIAWKEMLAQGIDAFDDLGSIRYMGFPQDDIVGAVLNGEVDAGIVRSGLLELLAEEGSLKISQFRVLNANNQINYPYQISSRLYPEWPFAALPGADKALREQVVLSLLNTQKPEISRKYNISDIWSAPLSYAEVRDLMTSYRHKPGQEQLPQSVYIGQPIVFTSLAILAALLLSGIFVFYRQGTILHQLQGSSIPEPEEPEMAAARDHFDKLTPREREILVLICCGDQSKGIAEKLQISPKTVEFHRTNLLQKTKAGTTAHLVQLATRLGFDQGISPG